MILPELRDAFNHAMKPEPSNITLRHVLDLLHDGRTVYVCLEPGDATRYDLLITPVSGICVGDTVYGRLPSWGKEYSIMVTRLIGMRPAFSNMIAPNMFDGELLEIANNNQWSKTLLNWWTQIVVTQLAE